MGSTSPERVRGHRPVAERCWRWDSRRGQRDQRAGHEQTSGRSPAGDELRAPEQRTSFDWRARACVSSHQKRPWQILCSRCSAEQAPTGSAPASSRQTRGSPCMTAPVCIVPAARSPPGQHTVIRICGNHVCTPAIRGMRATRWQLRNGSHTRGHQCNVAPKRRVLSVLAVG